MDGTDASDAPADSAEVAVVAMSRPRRRVGKTITVVLVGVTILAAASWLVVSEHDRRKGAVRTPAGEYYRLFYFTRAPYSYLVEKTSRNVAPVLPDSDFKAMALFEQYYPAIRAEAMAVMNMAPAFKDALPLFGKRIGSDANDAKWQAFVLTWYGKDYEENLRRCPVTAALVKNIPDVRCAMFSIVGPRSRIVAHQGPFRGALRFHLGLTVPRDWRNCYILVDGQKVHWREGKGVLFDDTYVHEVRNDTDEPRIVLFCDVDRHLEVAWAERLNQAVLNSPLLGWISSFNNKNEKQMSTTATTATTTPTS